MYDKKPVDHLEGRWERGKRYSLHAIVENNGSFFRSLSGKPKAEPYVISQGDTFVANEGWEIVYMSEDSRVSSKNALGKLAVLEDFMGITLDPDIDEKYYKYFTIEATQDETSVYFRQSNYAVEDGLDPLKVEVSTDNGETWTKVTAAPEDDGVPGAPLVVLYTGDKVLIRGKNEAYGYYSDNIGDLFENCNFYADSPCYVYGNIMSLIGGDDFARLRKVVSFAFTRFFSDYSGDLDWSWVLSKDGEELLLPATKLASRCYSNMFNGCTGLTTAPALPATTMVESCYSSMFNGCTGLTTAPTLPATTMAESCYYSMFYGCTALATAPTLPATTLASSCYNNMFAYCTNLTSAPTLQATTLVSRCYQSMFEGCSNLSYIKAMFTTTPGSSYTANWVKNVKGTGTFVKNSAATWDVSGANGVPAGWTVETASA